MTDLDPDVQREVDAAVAELARRLRYPTGGPEQTAREFLDWQHDHGWRPIPRPPDVVTDRRPGDPPNPEWRAARQALARTEGDQP